MRVPRQHTRGAALVTAMLTVTLVAVLAATALWQQWRSVQIEGVERDRQQAAWVLMGALDWARLVLREDARAGGADHLSEPWAVPLREARLSSFLAAGQSSDTTQELAQAFLSGRISDAQAKLNVFNLVENGQVSPLTLSSFTRLFEVLGLPASELQTLVRKLQWAQLPKPEPALRAQVPLLPTSPTQLAWLGLSPSTVQTLEPYITWLPERTPLNLNTAPAEVLVAALPGLDRASAQRMVAVRARAHFETLAAAARTSGLPEALLAGLSVGVSSRFFEVRGQLRLGDLVVTEISLLKRDGLSVRTLWRERVPPQAWAPAPL